MRLSRRVAVRGLYSFFALFLVWVLFCFPRRDRQLFVAMPSDATIIAELARPAESVPDALSNPLVALALDSVIGEGRTALLADDERLMAAIRFLAPERVVIGGRRDHYYSGRSAVYAASYLGWRARLVKTALHVGWVPGLGRLKRSDNGSYCISVSSPEGPLTLGLGMVDGVLLCALSRDSSLIAEMVSRVKQNHRVVPLLSQGEWQNETDLFARAWVSYMEAGRYFPGAGDLAVSVDTVTAEGLSMRVEGETLSSAISGACSRRYSSVCDVNPVVAGTVLDFTFPGQTVLAWLEIFLPGIVAMMEVDLSGDAVFLLAGEPYEGRISGLRVPALSLSLPLSDGDEQGDWLPVLLDRINNESGRRFWAQRVSGEHGIYSFDDDVDGFYDAFAPNERFGLVLAQGRAIFGSCVTSLGKGLGEMPAFDHYPGPGDEDELCLFSLYADLKQLNRELGYILAVWRMGGMTAGENQAPDNRFFNGMKRLATVLERVDSHGELRVLSTRRCGREMIQIRFGPAEN